jgi:enamine deaminase RidA (YjgF/YER057c/UK114 family)
MEKQFINPAGLHDPSQFFTHVITARGGTMVFISGQSALDEHRRIVGHGDMRAQVRKAFSNLKLALEAAGATPEDVVKLTIFVKDYEPEDLGPIEEGLDSCFGLGREFASTLVGVERLALDGLLVEVEAIAVIE